MSKELNEAIDTGVRKLKNISVGNEDNGYDTVTFDELELILTAMKVEEEPEKDIPTPTLITKYDKRVPAGEMWMFNGCDPTHKLTEVKPDPIKEVYEKWKGLEFKKETEENIKITQLVAYANDMWQAIKQHCEVLCADSETNTK